MALSGLLTLIVAEMFLLPCVKFAPRVLFKLFAHKYYVNRTNDITFHLSHLGFACSFPHFRPVSAASSFLYWISTVYCGMFIQAGKVVVVRTKKQTKMFGKLIKN